MRSFPSAFDVTPLEPFYVESDSLFFGSTSIVFVDVAGQHWRRTEHHIQQDRLDALAVNVSIDISARGVMGDREVDQVPGSIGLHDMSRPSEHRSTSGNSIQLLIPRNTALRYGIDPAHVCGIVLPAKHSRVLTAHLHAVRNFPPAPDVASQALVEASILDLLCFAIRAASFDPGAASIGCRDSVVRKIEEFVLARLESPTLRVASVARELKLSRSTLYRCFLDRGGLQAFIRDARLDAARTLLLDPNHGPSIAEISERYCFSDVGHLSRLFRKRFGLPPAAFREMHQPQHSQ